MQTELTTWVHLQVPSSVIQLMKKTCRQNSLPECICQWCHQPSSSLKKHADRTHWLDAFTGGLISHPAHEKNMQTELTGCVHLPVASSAIQLVKKNMQTELTT